jgi:Flp pilus assembly pilin Flp
VPSSGLRRDRRGAAAVEFAVVALPFVTLVLLILEVAWQTAVAASIDHGVREAGRWAALGQPAPAGRTREQEMLGIIADGSGLPLGPDLSLTIRSYASFAAAGDAAQARCPAGPAGGGAGVSGALGGPRMVMRYDVSYRSAGLTPIGRSLLPLGMLSHCIVLVTVNEPFPES